VSPSLIDAAEVAEAADAAEVAEAGEAAGAGGAAGAGEPVGVVCVRVGSARLEGGMPTLERLHCAGALAARLTPDGLVLVGAGAQPVGDDRLDIGIELGEGAHLAIRSSGATLARAGEPGAVSTTATTVSVGPGASLSWIVEPSVAASGAIHRSRTSIALDVTARLAWRDEVILGRYGESVPGSWATAMDLRRGGAALRVGETQLGPNWPSWSSSVVTRGARCYVAVVIVDPGIVDLPDLEGLGDRVGNVAGADGVALRLEGPAVELAAWGASLAGCRTLIGRWACELAMPWLPREITHPDRSLTP